MTYQWPQLPSAVASYSYSLCSSLDFRTKRNTHTKRKGSNHSFQPLSSKMSVNTDDWISNNGRGKSLRKGLHSSLATFIFRESNALLQTYGCQEASLHPSTSCDHSHIMPLACSFLKLSYFHHIFITWSIYQWIPDKELLLHNSRQEPRITLWKAWQSIDKSILIIHSHILSVFLDTIRLQYDYI